MKNFNTYKELEKLSKSLSESDYSLPIQYNVCWNYAEQIRYSIIDDLNFVGLICFVKSIEFVIEDSGYRQSASGCLMILKVEEDEDFEISVECLIDHQRIMLQVRQPSENRKVGKIASQIIRQYNQEMKTELSDLKI